MTTESRIAELEAQVAVARAEISAAQAELDGLKPRKAAPPVKPVDDRPLISILQPPGIELPTGEQCKQLIDVISRHHLMLQPRYSMRWHLEEARELHAGFATSARFISTLGRTSVDTKYYLSSWVDRTKDWARLVDHNPVGNIGVSFFLAAVAMGVPYQLGNNAMGVLPAVGLREHGGERLMADGWKRTLEGNVLAPTAPERRFA
jgi:hypothetical protein